MPEIIKLGKYADQESRWPHGHEFYCPECHSKFKLTVNDTRECYYSSTPHSYEGGDQRDSYRVNGHKITLPCPVCGETVTAVAPEGWYPGFPHMLRRNESLPEKGSPARLSVKSNKAPKGKENPDSILELEVGDGCYTVSIYKHVPSGRYWFLIRELLGGEVATGMYEVDFLSCRDAAYRQLDFLHKERERRDHGH